MQEIKSPILAINELHSQALIFLIAFWKQLFSKVTTLTNNRSTPQTLNIVELATIGEKVVVESVNFMQKVMKVRHNSIDDLKDHCDIVKEELLDKLKKKK